jgi:uncharacterized membrane protein YqgA involved in biofilm formation
MKGTIVNTISVILGSSLGLLLHKNFPEKISKIAFQGIGLFTIMLGIKMALESKNLMVMIFSILLGGIGGEFLNLENKVESLSNKLKNKIKSKNERFTEGLLTAFLLFCMGSMTVLGAFEEGLGKGVNLLLAKSVLDGFASIALSASLGIGVLFAAVPLLLYQGGLTLLANFLSHYLSNAVVTEVSGVGGLLLIGLGLNILEIKKIKVLNLLPSLLFAAVIAFFLIQK